MEESLCSGAVPVRPYWGPSLAHDRELRLSFLRRLLKMRLGGHRRSTRAKVGFFFVQKKNASGGMAAQQRMVVDARVANCMHRRPPHTRLGTGAAISRLRLPSEIPGSADYHCAALDLDDSFYQFADDNLSAWFGVEWPETAEVWGVHTAWDDELQQKVAVDDDEIVYSCFRGLAMGCTWALFFCQAVLAVACRRTPRGPILGVGVLEDRVAAPTLAKHFPVVGVYVDNALVIGFDREDTELAFKALQDDLDENELVLHVDAPVGKHCEFVGYIFDFGRLEVRNTQKRC